MSYAPGMKESRPHQAALIYSREMQLTLYVYHKVCFIGWVGVGWQRHCKTRLSLRLSSSSFSLAVGHTAGDRVIDQLCGAESIHAAQGE